MSAQIYKMLAIQLGDALKYETSLNEINRAGKSIFPFERDQFPNESISSVRAKCIYDWILTLTRQKISEDDRSTWLKSFIDLLTPETHKKKVYDLLNHLNSIKHDENAKEKHFFIEKKFHSQILHHCTTLFVNSHYFHAVFEAAKIYHKLVQEKSKSPKDGASLMLEMWGPKGVLKITPCESETDKNVQDGMAFLSAGLMRAIRNPTAHEPALDWPISKEDCLDILSFISFLLRKLDDSVYWDKSNPESS
ncbi:TIGR02391 family protein [Parachlamydia sp.]|uniref:TIGR02391 family protein n=1 Tax=Parachlamydia sp. TaxID=2052048 RepID=UPI003D0CB9B2